MRRMIKTSLRHYNKEYFNLVKEVSFFGMYASEFNRLVALQLFATTTTKNKRGTSFSTHYKTNMRLKFKIQKELTKWYDDENVVFELLRIIQHGGTILRRCLPCKLDDDTDYRTVRAKYLPVTSIFVIEYSLYVEDTGNREEVKLDEVFDLLANVPGYKKKDSPLRSRVWIEH